jgi:Fe-S-cluster containining protein
MPIFHEGQRCTACCRWPEQVRLPDAEITRRAAHLGLSEHEFIQTHTGLRPDRGGLALQDKPNGECTFLVGESGAVQPVKPQLCRDFPDLWNLPGFEKVCHAIPQQVEEEEYRRLIQRATGRNLPAV